MTTRPTLAALKEHTQRKETQLPASEQQEKPSDKRTKYSEGRQSNDTIVAAERKRTVDATRKLQTSQTPSDDSATQLAQLQNEVAMLKQKLARERPQHKKALQQERQAAKEREAELELQAAMLKQKLTRELAQHKKALQQECQAAKEREAELELQAAMLKQKLTRELAQHKKALQQECQAAKEREAELELEAAMLKQKLARERAQHKKALHAAEEREDALKLEIQGMRVAAAMHNRDDVHDADADDQTALDPGVMPEGTPQSTTGAGETEPDKEVEMDDDSTTLPSVAEMAGGAAEDEPARAEEDEDDGDDSELQEPNPQPQEHWSNRGFDSITIHEDVNWSIYSMPGHDKPKQISFGLWEREMIQNFRPCGKKLKNRWVKIPQSVLQLGEGDTAKFMKLGGGGVDCCCPDEKTPKFRVVEQNGTKKLQQLHGVDPDTNEKLWKPAVDPFTYHDFYEKKFDEFIVKPGPKSSDDFNTFCNKEGISNYRLFGSKWWKANADERKERKEALETAAAAAVENNDSGDEE